MSLRGFWQPLPQRRPFTPSRLPHVFALCSRNVPAGYKTLLVGLKREDSQVMGLRQKDTLVGLCKVPLAQITRDAPFEEWVDVDVKFVDESMANLAPHVLVRVEVEPVVVLPFAMYAPVLNLLAVPDAIAYAMELSHHARRELALEFVNAYQGVGGLSSFLVP